MFHIPPKLYFNSYLPDWTDIYNPLFLLPDSFKTLSGSQRSSCKSDPITLLS